MRSPLRVIAISSAALFVPLVIPLATGRVFTLDDLGRYHIPMRHVYWEALHRGDSILWTPAVFRQPNPYRTLRAKLMDDDSGA